MGGIFSIFSTHNFYKMDTADLFLKTYYHSESDNTSSLIAYMQLSGFPAVRMW